MKKISLAFTVTALALLLVGCGKTNDAKKVNAVGSTAIQPLVEQASLDYKRLHGEANITVQGGGSGTGLSQVSSGSVTIGDSDIFAEQKQGINAKKLVDHKVAVVGLTPVVNAKNGIKNLTSQQLKDVFSGKIKNWKQAGGNNIPVTVIQAPQGSGGRVTFESTALKGVTPVAGQEQDSNGTIKKIISTTPGTIGYINLPYLRSGSGVKQISIDNITANYQNITDNKWKMWSYEHMYTGLKPNQGTKEFINYIMSKKTQDNLIRQAGYVSISDMHYVLKPNGDVVKREE